MPHPKRPRCGVSTRGLAATAVLALAGCASLPGYMPAGTPIDKARHALFGPTEEFALPNGGTRLEFTQGKQTYMLDFDRGGLLVSSQQVLTEANLQALTPGMTAGEVRLRYGRPFSVLGVSYQNEQVWNYRFDGGDCVLYQVSISNATQRVTQSGVGTDDSCGGGSHDRR